MRKAAFKKFTWSTLEYFVPFNLTELWSFVKTYFVALIFQFYNKIQQVTFTCWLRLLNFTISLFLLMVTVWAQLVGKVDQWKEQLSAGLFRTLSNIDDVVFLQKTFNGFYPLTTFTKNFHQRGVLGFETRHWLFLILFSFTKNNLNRNLNNSLTRDQPQPASTQELSDCTYQFFPFLCLS